MLSQLNPNRLTLQIEIKLFFFPQKIEVIIEAKCEATAY